MAMKKRGRGKLAALTVGLMLFCGGSIGETAALSIQEAVDLALAQNTSLRITEKGEETARAALKSARGANSFDLGLSGSLTDGRTNNEARQDNGSLTLRAGLPLYNGGRNQANIESAEIGVDAARLKTERERENLRLSVIQTYYNVLEAQKKIEIAQETVEKYQAHLTNVEQLFVAGSKARLDVLRSSVELTNAKQLLLKAENDYEVKMFTLKNLLRLDAKEELILTQDFQFVPFHPGMDACVDYAYLHRKDLLIDVYNLKQRELDIKAARAGYLPSLSLSASTGASERFNPGSDHNHNYQVGLSASWNLFDSGVTEAAVDKAKTARDQAELTLLKDKEDISFAVRQLYYSMREAERRFAVTRAAVSEAEEDYYIASEKYRAGQGILLDIIDSQEALATAELNFNSAQYDYARFKAAVENAMGLELGEDPGVADPERTAEREAFFRERGIVPQGPRASADYRRAKEVIDANTPAKWAEQAAKEAAEAREGKGGR